MRAKLLSTAQGEGCSFGFSNFTYNPDGSTTTSMLKCQITLTRLILSFLRLASEKTSLLLGTPQLCELQQKAVHGKPSPGDLLSSFCNEASLPSQPHQGLFNQEKQLQNLHRFFKAIFKGKVSHFLEA